MPYAIQQNAYDSRGKPNTGWWMEQIYAGIAYRKKYASEESWERWRSYYRGFWRPGVLPVNLFFTLMRTIVPRVYFRNPSISVTSGMPGPMAMAFSQVMERTDNKLLDLMGAKKQLKRVVQHGFQFGTGVGKLGFGAYYTPSPDYTVVAEPVSKKGIRVEYRDGIYPMMPWFKSIHPGSFLVPDGTETFEEARWVAHWVRRPTEDVKDDPRLDVPKDFGSAPNGRTPLRYGVLKNSVDMVDLIEIRDKKRQTVMVINPYSNSEAAVLYYGPDELQANGAFPLYPLTFNEDDQCFWGTPDSRILEPYQLEINEIKTQSMKHRRLALIKLLAKRKGIEEDEVQKMLTEDVNSVVWTNADPKDVVMPFQVSHIPQDLIVAEQGVMQNVRETIGFSRNQFGEYNPGSGDTTATEANIVRMATEIRVDERRDVTADLLVSMVEDMHQIIFRHWTAKQVVEVVGPGGVPVWVSFSGQELATGGHFTVKVDPDSSVPETKQLREQRATNVYAILKTNPLIDPMKLTQYLLHELHGVSFDDMIRALPALPPNGQGATPQDAMGLKQYGGMIQQSLQQPALAARDQTMGNA